MSLVPVYLIFPIMSVKLCCTDTSKNLKVSCRKRVGYSNMTSHSNCRVLYILVDTTSNYNKKKLVSFTFDFIFL